MQQKSAAPFPFTIPHPKQAILHSLPLVQPLSSAIAFQSIENRLTSLSSLDPFGDLLGLAAFFCLADFSEFAGMIGF